MRSAFFLLITPSISLFKLDISSPALSLFIYVPLLFTFLFSKNVVRLDLRFSSLDFLISLSFWIANVLALFNFPFELNLPKISFLFVFVKFVSSLKIFCNSLRFCSNFIFWFWIRCSFVIFEDTIPLMYVFTLLNLVPCFTLLYALVFSELFMYLLTFSRLR